MDEASTPSSAHSGTGNALAAGWTHLPGRCRFLLTGPDTVRYLNGQVSNQVDHLPPGVARYALITNHKGQLEGDLFITSQPDADPPALIVDADGSLRESLHARLERYIIADDVTLTDITDEWHALHVLGSPESSLDKDCPGAQCSLANRFGLIGLDVWLPRGVSEDALCKNWAKLGLSELSAETLEWIRVSHGLPAWDRELKPGMLPPEARLETRAIDYKKGCYIGQEVLSRIKSVGKVNRLLVLLEPEPGESQPEVGSALCLPDVPEDRPPLGAITSVANRPERPEDAHGDVRALGYVKSKHADPGTVVLAGNAQSGAKTRLTVLPFPSTPEP